MKRNPKCLQPFNTAMRRLLLFLGMTCMVHVLQAQEVTVRGKISDSASGQPIIGASVMLKNAEGGVTSGADGSFSINVPRNAVLNISSVGYKPVELQVASLSNLENLVINLSPDLGQLSSVVVVGYGTQKKVTVTGSVVTIKGDELQKSPNVNLSNSLAGRLPGITSVQSSGEPGYDGSSIRIRGSNTLGNSDALIVIDGVPERTGGLERLNPADIESFSILKDASAAIYGARAANGVILITTKRGKSGKPRLSYDFNQGWAQPTRIPEMSNAVEYATINNELVLFDKIPADQWAAAWQTLQQTGSYTNPVDNTTTIAPYQPEALQAYVNGSDPWRYPNTDWFGDALKTWSPQTKHSVQLNGGSEHVQYYASLGYQNQDAYYKNSATGYKQYEIRFNLDATINKYVKTSLGIMGREEYRFFPTVGAQPIFRMLMRGKPTEPEIWPNGLPGPDIENGQNPIVITTNQTGYDRDRRDFIQTNGRIELSIPGVTGLKLTGSAAVDKYIYRNKRWETPWYLYFWDKVSYEPDGVTPLLTRSVRSTFTDPRLTLRDENRLNILLSGFLNYDRTFADDHTFNFLAAVTRETVESDNFNAFRRYFISPVIDQLFAGGDPEKNNGGGAYQRARLSYFGRLSYNYREKYLAEFLWRYDGSYIFPESGRFGFFPGILVGWNISQENFFKNHVNFMNYLKLRASYGQMGNDQVFYNGSLQEYQYLSTYGFSTYIFDDQLQKILYETRLPNPNFTWEVANNANLGIDAQLFNGSVVLEFDLFYNKRTNILTQATGVTPLTTGITLPPENIGEVHNKGWEFKIGHSGRLGELDFNVSVNGGYARNEIRKFSEAPGAPDWQLATGKGFGSNGANFLAYEYDGVFRDQEEIDKNTLDYSAFTGQLLPGDMKFRDINGDGVIDGDDQVRLDKNRDPYFTGGLNINLRYKNFDCSILVQGAVGGLLFIGTESGDIGNFLKYSYDHRWSADNPSSTDPRLANRGDTYYTAGGAGNNTYWLRNSDYLRLKNMEIGYTMPVKITEKAGISYLRFYVNGFNLLTLDQMKIWDPESTSGSGQYYPQSRIINTGLRVTF